MSLKDEFHAYLDGDWPLWKVPKNKDGVLYNQLYRAFAAGFSLADNGISPNRFRGTGKAIPAMKAITTPPRKFKPPRLR